VASGLPFGPHRSKGLWQWFEGFDKIMIIILSAALRTSASHAVAVAVPGKICVRFKLLQEQI
jgi:hypothetical protein